GEIKTVVSMSGLENHVRFLGSLSDEDLVNLYHACDVVILPALDIKDDIEGFGIVALEAAAAGKPVVATRVGGIPDGVEDGKSGALVSPGDYTAFSRVVISFLKNRELSLSLGQYGRSRASEEFSWRHVVGIYEGVFDAAIGKPG
ncbi:MAG TPA: glycosyltransferase family 4 protein, partial [Candidatus Binatia bacterium]